MNWAWVAKGDLGLGPFPASNEHQLADRSATFLFSAPAGWLEEILSEWCFGRNDR